MFSPKASFPCTYLGLKPLYLHSSAVERCWFADGQAAGSLYTHPCPICLSQHSPGQPYLVGHIEPTAGGCGGCKVSYNPNYSIIPWFFVYYWSVEITKEKAGNNTDAQHSYDTAAVRWLQNKQSAAGRDFSPNLHSAAARNVQFE